MKPFSLAILVLLLVSLAVYFVATPWVASVTGVNPRTISLTSGLAVIALAVIGVLAGRMSARSRD